MDRVLKVLTAILGILAVLVCLATIGVVGFSMAGGRIDQTFAKTEEDTEEPEEPDNMEAAPTPTTVPDSDGETENHPVSIVEHVHDYKESIDRKATCYQAGRIKYTCRICDDSYYTDVPSTDHVPDEWEIIREPSETRDGLREKRCIYCDEVIAQENIPYQSATSSSEQAPHVHEYRAETEREPSCILAGLRKYTCTCGSFYTEQISAPGHIATDWTVAEEATATKLGREQRTCTECGVLLDSRPIPVVPASPSPSSGNNSSGNNASGSSGTAASAAPTGTPQSTNAPASSPSASPTATPHVHEYTSYVIKEANCKEVGVRSFVCSCGSSYAESIPLDATRHNYKPTIIAPTITSNGYTLYWCTRCNDTYMDNYTDMLK